jgi:hypothetical protein
MFLVLHVMRRKFVRCLSETARIIGLEPKQVESKVFSKAFSYWVENNEQRLESCASKTAKPFQLNRFTHSDSDQWGLPIWSIEAEQQMKTAQKAFETAFLKFNLPLPPRMPFMVDGNVRWSTVGTMCV